jgi:hypothetical protein
VAAVGGELRFAIGMRVSRSHLSDRKTPLVEMKKPFAA